MLLLLMPILKQKEAANKKAGLPLSNNLIKRQPGCFLLKPVAFRAHFRMSLAFS